MFHVKYVCDGVVYQHEPVDDLALAVALAHEYRACGWRAYVYATIA